MNKQSFKGKGLSVALFALPLYANAVPVDLSGWTAEGGSSNWVVQPGNDSVLQTVNGNPTVFYNPAVTSTQGTALNGKITVTTSSDDDFIGFVLGYNPGEITSATADFFLVDWKQGTQPYGAWGTGKEGLAISRVTNAEDGYAFWGHGSQITGSSVVDEIQRGATLGSTGWNDFQEYSFNILFTSSLIEVEVNGLLELSITPSDAGLTSFEDGGFGFYNFSQSDVLYSAIRQVDCAVTPADPACAGGGGRVPEPSVFLLMLAGLPGIFYVHRKRQ